METKGVHFRNIKGNLDTSTPTGKLILTMIGAINEFGRTNMLGKQREGTAIAKAKGKYRGRKEVNIEDLEEHYNRYMKRKVSESALVKELSISRPTLDKLIEEHEKKEQI